MLKRMTIRATLLAVAVVTSMSAHAIADTSKDVDIPAGDLGQALLLVSQQYGVDLVYRPEQVKGLRTGGVSGDFSPRDAVMKLLEGTPLQLRTDEASGALLITTPLPSGGRASSMLATDENPPKPAADADSAAVAQKRSFWSRFRLAQNDQGEPSSSSKTVEKDNQNPLKDSEEQMGEVVVTGSRLKRSDAETALPVNIYTKEEIDRSGQPTLGGFLNTLSEVSISSREGSFTATGGQSTVQLRGLPIGTTLVLLNGRRTQAVSSFGDSSLFNLDLIPFSAIERVEILPVGSSAIYGGDALAGVVNVILRKSVDGAAADVSVAMADGTGDGSVSLLTGRQFDRGSFLLLGAYSKKTPLYAGERDFFRDADYRRFGGTDRRSRFCIPGTVSSATGANLPGLTSSFAGIPSTPSGQSLTVADFAASAGTANLCASLAQGNGATLVQGVETASVHMTGDYRPGETWSVFGELTYSNYRQRADSSALALSDVLVPATNPFNPFGENVRVRGRLGSENGLAGSRVKSEFASALLGVRGALSPSWDFEVSAATARDDSNSAQINGFENSGPLQTALAASTPAAALNPFTSSRAADDDILGAIWTDLAASGAGERNSLNAFVRGPVVELPAGSLDVIAGVDLGHEGWASEPEGFNPFFTQPFDLTRTTKSVFLEGRVPLLSSMTNTGRKLDNFAITLAGRRDDYDDFGNAGTYQAGLEIRPGPTVLLRAATATSFKPPLLTQLNPLEFSFPTEIFGLTDPLRGNEAIVGGEIFFGRNPQLKAEKGEANSVGLAWEPQVISGFRLGLTAWQIELRDQITFPGSPQSLLNNEAELPGYVSREPSVAGVPGRVTRVLWSFLNFGTIDVEGGDLDAEYRLPLRAGNLTLSASASRTMNYDVQLTPDSVVESRLGTRNTEAWAPKWKGRLAAGLQTGPWSFEVTARHLGNYQDAGASPRTLGGIWWFDTSANVEVTELWPTIGSTFESCALSLAVVNVGDELPEYANDPTFHDPTQGDWRGRRFSLRFSVKW